MATLFQRFADMLQRAVIKTVSSADYIVLDNDGYTEIHVTTGASDRTITLPTLADNQNRHIKILKVDNGVGKIIIDGEGTETINESLTQNITAQYDYRVVRGITSTWLMENGNPMTTLGDTIIGGATGSLTRLALGSANQKLFVNAAENGLEYASGMKGVVITRDLSLASGNQIVTGIGFKPNSLLCFLSCGIAYGTSWGIADSISVQSCIYSNSATFNQGGALGVVVVAAGYQIVNYSTLDADGFTLTWTKYTSPVGTATLTIFCFR
jgi:hypothetical protein